MSELSVTFIEVAVPTAPQIDRKKLFLGRDGNLKLIGPDGTVELVGGAGTAGPKGEKGDPGQPGIQGPAGAAGSAGAAATIAVGTVTTGAPGSDATVTNVGTSAAAIFDFSIPRGDTGATGVLVKKGFAESGTQVTSTSFNFTTTGAGPTSSQGVELFTLAFTPASATNILTIRVSVPVRSTANASQGVALFKDADAACLKGRVISSAANFQNQIQFTHRMVAGTASAITFRLRGAGTNSTLFMPDSRSWETGTLEIEETTP